ncbi:MAG: DUF1566 domain-containing protein [Mangrovibacterium sp.]
MKKNFILIIYFMVAIVTAKGQVTDKQDSINHYIGELYGGGVIFYVDHTGKHGLICSLIDVSMGSVWSNISNERCINAQSQWDGRTNTLSIINQNGHTTSAAKLCHDYKNADYGTGIYSDWYLPAIDELNLLYNVKYEINKILETDNNELTTKIIDYDEGVGDSFYWSSTEDGIKHAFFYYFYSGAAWGHLTPTGAFGWNKTRKLFVRAVRRF